MPNKIVRKKSIRVTDRTSATSGLLAHLKAVGDRQLILKIEDGKIKGTYKGMRLCAYFSDTALEWHMYSRKNNKRSRQDVAAIDKCFQDYSPNNH